MLMAAQKKSPSFILPMDVRGKQGLFYHVVFLPLTCADSVCRQVNAAVWCFLLGVKWLDKSTTKQYSIYAMDSIKAYEEVVDFIAAGTTPQNVIAFRPSEAAQERVEDLLSREKEGELSPAERSELDHYLQLEHLMRLAKARARDFLPNE